MIVFSLLKNILFFYVHVKSLGINHNLLNTKKNIEKSILDFSLRAEQFKFYIFYCHKMNQKKCK